ncbi:hypothetical protein MMC29_004883 [Sticta canariensis]|nr:hypothetical protein [Sticta canariensis]
MKWLEGLVHHKGAKLITRTIEGDLFDSETELRTEYNVDVIINASGLAGTELAGDTTCYPIRSGPIRVINNGSKLPKVDHALTIAAGAFHDSSEIVFIVPRNDNILLIGGIAEPNENELSLTLDSPIIKRMRARCEAFLPNPKSADLDPEYPLASGLRPFRQRDVRVERDLRWRGSANGSAEEAVPSRIVHSYGRGCSGWTLSLDVPEMSQRLLKRRYSTCLRELWR